MKSLYTTLNENSKNWWYFVQLRKEGKVKEARLKERKSILDTVENLRDALNYKGYLYLGRKSWSLEVCEHKPKWSDNSTQTYSKQGYYGLGQSCYLEEVCKRLNIPILDSRNINDDEVWEFLKLPLINKSLKSNDDSYVSLLEFVKLAHSKFTNFKSENIL